MLHIMLHTLHMLQTNIHYIHNKPLYMFHTLHMLHMSHVLHTLITKVQYIYTESISRN